MKWLGSKIDKCDLCTDPIKDKFIDGRLSAVKTWAIMCERCFRKHGVGLGIGKGQMYEKQGDDWIKSV